MTINGCNQSGYHAFPELDTQRGKKISDCLISVRNLLCQQLVEVVFRAENCGTHKHTHMPCKHGKFTSWKFAGAHGVLACIDMMRTTIRKRMLMYLQVPHDIAAIILALRASARFEEKMHAIMKMLTMHTPECVHDLPTC
jgi:hypothetical protein